MNILSNKTYNELGIIYPESVRIYIQLLYKLC